MWIQINNVGTVQLDTKGTISSSSFKTINKMRDCPRHDFNKNVIKVDTVEDEASIESIDLEHSSRKIHCEMSKHSEQKTTMVIKLLDMADYPSTLWKIHLKAGFFDRHIFLNATRNYISWIFGISFNEKKTQRW